MSLTILNSTAMPTVHLLIVRSPSKKLSSSSSDKDIW